jgi:hypothetical protein
MEKLGVDVYVPRAVLPRAKASVTPLQPAMAEPVKSAAAAPAPAATRQRGDGQKATRPGLDLPATAGAERARKAFAPAQPRAPGSARSPRFALLTVAFEGALLFVSDLKSAPLQPALEASVLQFLGEVMFALGRAPASTPAPVYFQWPLVNKPGADISGERARDVLAGFIDRQLRETRPQHVVLLGEQASRYIQAEGEHLSGSQVQIWRSAALGKIFAQPQLKADLWRILQPLAVDA